jgi:hypothetical protein
VLNAALSANPIGLVIAGIALLVGGLILAYKKSETFRNVVQSVGDVLSWVWHSILVPVGSFVGKVLVAYLRTLAKMWLTMAEFGVRAFRFLLNAAFTAFAGILDAATAGLGWIPGIGPKIKTANRAFDSFRQETIAKLDAVANKARDLNNALDHASRDRVSHFTVIYDSQGNAHSTAGGKDPGDPKARTPRVTPPRSPRMGDVSPHGRTADEGRPLVHIDTINTRDDREAARQIENEQRRALAMANLP